ncbi:MULTISPECIES: type I restriction-modification system subunit M [unclassified Mycoplasma]|uniref:type I restriction-modification system subunit M n=1 Tax=unclassified Mycoplasma TaxID=2683645 RepID=UPI00211BBE4F|nr:MULTISPECIES: type I restriction-modification system subunit M [unclassified Mycoplasma]UUM19793.1 type I restriction-modification system subunit M [Mycoplasma sp. 1578d]UUM24777.1 type I restriction-modification system subunit M [Mycoplasma sp. 3686d]
MDNKRDIERTELHNAIWKIAEELRGSVDGWDFKTYVLGFLFYRYISENLVHYINKDARENGLLDFDYEKCDDSEIDEDIKKGIIKGIGYFIKPSDLFINVQKRALDDPDLNINLQRIFSSIEKSASGNESQEDFEGLFNDLDFNSQKLGKEVNDKNKTIIKLLENIGAINLGKTSQSSVDIFGDAYEFLLSMYASSAGKSGGEFFTPPEVSTLLATIAIDNKKQINKVYDPTCGSGSLLLKAIKLLGENKNNITGGFYGQEINITTFNLCRMNMFLHDVEYDKFNIRNGDTLLNPMHLDQKPFDVIVSNPPYSLKWEGSDNPTLINDSRFKDAGVLAPKSKADLAFVMHSLDHLSEDGVAAIVCFPGVFYRAGAEQKIRKYLVDTVNAIEAIIQMPDNLFYGTSIATTILVLRRNKKDNNILFIDASDIVEKAKKGNKLSQANIDQIAKLYFDRKDVENLAKVVSKEEIANNNYNLSVSQYLQKKTQEEVIDIKELNAQIKEITAKQDQLRTQIDKIIEELDKEFE